MPCPKGAQIGMASERLEQSSFVINEICRERHPIGFRHIEDSTILNKIFASMENVLFAALNPNVCAHTHHKIPFFSGMLFGLECRSDVFKSRAESPWHFPLSQLCS